MDNPQRNVTDLDSIAYSVGFMLGDGCLYANPSKGDYRIQWASMDTECLEKIKQQVNTDRPITQIKGKNCGLLSIHSKEYWQFWVDVTAFKKKVPEYYLTEAPIDVVLEVIAGLMDSDGSIQQKNTKHQLKIGQKIYKGFSAHFYNNEPEIVTGFVRLCKRAGIRITRVRQYTTQSGVIGYDVNINISDLCDAVTLHCDRKEARLREYDSITHRPNRRRRSETRPPDACAA
jgi:hypothetical protein